MAEESSLAKNTNFQYPCADLFDSQMKDFQHHKLICPILQDRRRLYRVTTTAQKLFYIYRELTWSQVSIDSVDIPEGALVLRGDVRYLINILGLGREGYLHQSTGRS